MGNTKIKMLLKVSTHCRILLYSTSWELYLQILQLLLLNLRRVGRKMKTIIITTQKELDDLPLSFEAGTRIEIKSQEIISVKRLCTHAIVFAYNSSVVFAYGSSKIYAYDSSKVYAYDLSRVDAYNSSKVYAFNSSRVFAYKSSRVSACDSSVVTAYGSSKVYAYNSSKVCTYESSIVDACESSIVYANDSSKVYAYNLSKVFAHGSSTVHAYNSSIVHAYRKSSTHIYNKDVVCLIYDNSHAFVDVNEYEFEKIERNASYSLKKDEITPTFDMWLERGIVHADGMYCEYLSHKQIDAITIYETDYKGDTLYVAKKDSDFAHGETESEAILDLKFKTSNRDTSQFKDWGLNDIKTKEELIFAYRCITGACKSGIKDFINSNQIPNEMKVSEAISVTNAHYGHDEFSSFFNGNLGARI